MKKRESLAEVLERLTREFVEAVVHEAEASIAEARGRKESRMRRSMPEAARRARTPRARTVAPTPAPAPAAKSKRGKPAPKKGVGKKKIEELGAAVVNPELLLAAIDQAEHAAEHVTVAPPPPASEPARKAEVPTLLAEPEPPASAPAPKAPPLKENETAITTPSGAIVIRRSRAA